MSAPQRALPAPTSAGIYDALLSEVPGDPAGKDNFVADREAAQALDKVTPLVREAVRDNREFLRRAVGWTARRGVTRFLDVGCGFSPLTGQTARDVNPAAEIAYADCDPVVVSHAAALLAGPGITAFKADVRDAGDIMARCADAGWDLARPVAVILGAVLQYLPAGEAREAVARYIPYLAPGSAVIISAGASDDPELATEVTAAYPGDGYWHDRDTFEGFFTGLALAPPGVTRARWWPLAASGEAGCKVSMLAGAGVKP